MARRLRILHVLHAFSAGGLENGIVNIINGSPDHLEHELCLLSKSGDFIERLKRPVVLHEMNKRQGNDVRLAFRLRKLFHQRRVDIVHTRNWGAFDGLIAACMTSRVTLIHGEHGRDIADPQGAARHRNLARRLLSFRARKYVAVSQDLYRWLDRIVHIPKGKLEFIPNGVDTEKFCNGRDWQLRAELGISANEYVVGTVGRLDPIKNHEGLVNALQLLQSSQRKVRLVIVGDGPNRPNVERALSAAKLLPKPHFLGHRSDVDRLYRTFDAFVLNSFGEGMSNTLLEAMASGIPIICTSVGGNVELIKHRESGMLVEPGQDVALAEALKELMDPSSALNSLASNARRFVVDNFSLSSMIHRYVQLYESVA